jgi:ABC-2 type transport system ATP-binding protein
VSSPQVVVEGLSVVFGRVEAVRRVDLTVAAGAATALVGRNGAGKSTTLKVLAGVVPASAGRVEVAGVDPTRDPVAAKRAVGYCPDVGGLVPRATPWDHLQLAARLRRMDDDWPARAQNLLEQFDLADVADRMTTGFSHGMSRRLSVVLAAFHRPQVLLLDEPFDGVDPLGVDATLLVVREAVARGASVLVSTHLLDLATEACDDAVVLRGGEVVSVTSAHELSGRSGRDRYRELLA